MFDANILDHLKDLLGEGNADILREILSVCRALVLDDDVRVEFGRAHEHARVIASETLCSLTGLLSRKYIHNYENAISTTFVAAIGLIYSSESRQNYFVIILVL